MPKSNIFPKIKPQVGSFNLKGLTLYELYHRQEMNNASMELLERWLDEYWDICTFSTWMEFDQLRKKLNRAIYLKELKIWFLSLIGR